MQGRLIYSKTYKYITMCPCIAYAYADEINLLAKIGNRFAETMKGYLRGREAVNGPGYNNGTLFGEITMINGIARQLTIWRQYTDHPTFTRSIFT